MIETLATTETLADILEMTRPGGRIVLKSRRYQPVSISVARLRAQEEVTFSAVNYGDFGESVRLLAERRIQVDDLFGENYPMEAFDRMLEAGRSGGILEAVPGAALTPVDAGSMRGNACTRSRSIGWRSPWR